MRRLLLSNTLNTRDLGGYPIDYRKVTAYKVFIRSDVPAQVTNEDIGKMMIKALLKKGIKIKIIGDSFADGAGSSSSYKTEELIFEDMETK